MFRVAQGYHSPDERNDRLFQTKLQTAYRTNARLLMQIRLVAIQLLTSQLKTLNVRHAQ